jgi:predicted NodU family carbamoyl transferase
MGDKGDYRKLSKIMLQEIVMAPHKVDAEIKMRENMHRGIMWWRPELQSEQDMNDIAAATQRIFELSLKHLSQWAKAETGSRHLALAGGGALNRQAVNMIKRKWKTVHVPQNPGDPGSCVGAVLAKTKQRLDLTGKWHS